MICCKMFIYMYSPQSHGNTDPHCALCQTSKSMQDLQQKTLYLTGSFSSKGWRDCQRMSREHLTIEIRSIKMVKTHPSNFNLNISHTNCRCKGVTRTQARRRRLKPELRKANKANECEGEWATSKC
jgi:hypothetical protein